jgi:DNA-binding NarL/FixJ family response regulator
VSEAFAAGASGYVLKGAAGSEVVAAIREVAGGGVGLAITGTALPARTRAFGYGLRIEQAADYVDEVLMAKRLS